ncbi:MAG: PfkB family carbohydrate kinase [Paracoccaceae bacterium]
MTDKTDILCIGSVLWDVIGRSSSVMRLGSDVPGRITRLPGGVAMNIAMTLKRFDMNPAILTAIGQDDEGRELLATARRMGIETKYVYLSEDLPTDRYMAVEGANGLIAAIADAHSLEAAGAKILRPLENGTLGDATTPYSGVIALDGNLTETLLREISISPLFATADLRVAPASPGKAERLLPLLTHASATIYLNLEEAGLLCHQIFDGAIDAAAELIRRGAHRVSVTNGGKVAAFGGPDGIINATPPEVLVTRVTGAGDTFMAAHIAADLSGSSSTQSLQSALRAAANYVSGDTPL